ncbi:protein of unknown function (plasmid) [Caballeronia sp. S22]
MCVSSNSPSRSIARHDSTRAAGLSLTSHSQPTPIHAADTRLIGASNRHQANAAVPLSPPWVDPISFLHNLSIYSHWTRLTRPAHHSPKR